MFHYVLASASEHPSLAAGQAPPGWLSPREEAALAQLTRLPRRRKWLMGRWAAKRVLVDVLGPVPARDLSVLNDESGAPYVERDGRRLELSLSISHRGDLGLAAVTQAPGVVVGADLEEVLPRELALVRQFFTDAEADAVARAQRPDLVVNRIWSAKEAVLKVLGVGLRLDTRLIEVGSEIDGDAPARWRPLAVLLRVPVQGQVRLLWRDEGAHVLTVALLSTRERS
jgi:4'-phosphopantetheinyl transferase